MAYGDRTKANPGRSPFVEAGPYGVWKESKFRRISHGLPSTPNLIRLENRTLGSAQTRKGVTPLTPNPYRGWGMQLLAASPDERVFVAGVVKCCPG